MAGADSIRCCAHCGEQFAPKINKTTGLPSVRPRIYCSRACLKKAAWQREKLKPRKRGPRTPQRVEGHCPACGLWFLRYRKGSIGGKADAGRYCSSECYAQMRATLSAERLALKRIAANWQPKPNPRVVCEIEALRRIAARPVVSRLTFAPCSGGCGTILPGYMGRSRRCQPCRREARRRFKRTEKGQALRRAHKAKRRAVERGLEADRIDPIKVFERDGWRCHLCGCKTPKRLRGTCEPSAPELDHVVPLALGGTHTWENVACACRKCNVEKGAKPLGQLFLSFAA